MSCDWAERVALLVDEEDAATRGHVNQCAECSALLAELLDDRDLLQSMPVPPMRVRMPRPQRVLWQWGALAAAVLIGALAWMYTARPVQAPVTVAGIPKPSISVEVPVAPLPAAPKRVVTAARRKPAPRQKAAVSTETLAAALEAALPPVARPPVVAKGEVVVAMQTEDPNVMIVLVGGDSDE